MFLDIHSLWGMCCLSEITKLPKGFNLFYFSSWLVHIPYIINQYFLCIIEKYKFCQINNNFFIILNLSFSIERTLLSRILIHDKANLSLTISLRNYFNSLPCIQLFWIILQLWVISGWIFLQGIIFCATKVTGNELFHKRAPTPHQYCLQKFSSNFLASIM